MTSRPGNSTARILMASLAGTAIEFFDFYIYATAAVLVFPKLFFPSSDPTAATLQSLATFALAFFARPVGSAVFGHFGDRIGRKATLVAALLTMGPHLRIDRTGGSRTASALPLRPGIRPRRGMGRGHPARHGERAAGET
jgi:MFS family permease